ncbi:hypothetical protein RhiTH_008833 [Rhizoctonia solani]
MAHALLSQVLAQGLPNVPDSVKEKYRWLQGVVRNATDFNVIVLKGTMNSGKYAQAPDPVDSFDIGAFTGVNGDNTVLTGISGGQAYKIEFDENNTFEFSIGFTSPAAGSSKAGIAASANPEDGYQAAEQGSNSIDSPFYEAKDTDGKTVRFKVNIKASAGDYLDYFLTMSRFTH